MIRRRSFPLLLLGAVAALVAGRVAALADASGSRPSVAPSPPTSLTVSPSGPDALALAWSASTPGKSTLAGYHVYRSGSLVGTTPALSFAVPGLACGTTYDVAVDAYDVRGRTSPQTQATGTTAACPAPPPGGTTVEPPGGTTTTGGVWKPAPGTTWQWQITGTVDETVPAQMFDVDLFEARPGEVNAGVVDRLHARGIRVVCYLDTGAWEKYRPDASQFPTSVIGNSTGWAGERWLDIRPASWPLFAPIIWARLDLAKALGCDGVEPDQNNPVGNNPGFPITYADEKAWYLEVARQAHLRGLSVGMKNGIEIVDQDLVAAFDWALNEECFEYDECDLMRPFVAAGKAVFQTEYATDPAVFCPVARSLGFSSIKKTYDLDAWRLTCW